MGRHESVPMIELQSVEGWRQTLYGITHESRTLITIAREDGSVVSLNGLPVLCSIQVWVNTIRSRAAHILRRGPFDSRAKWIDPFGEPTDEMMTVTVTPAPLAGGIDISTRLSMLSMPDPIMVGSTIALKYPAGLAWKYRLMTMPASTATPSLTRVTLESVTPERVTPESVTPGSVTPE